MSSKDTALRNPDAPLAPFLAVYALHSPLNDHVGEIYRRAAHSLTLNTGPFFIQTSKPVHVHTPMGHGISMAQETVQFPEGRYLIIQTDRRLDAQAYASASMEAHEVVAKLTILYPGLIAERKFEGFVNRPDSFVMAGAGPMKIVSRPDDSPQVVANALANLDSLLDAQPADTRERFRLAARWYAQGHSADALIDKFLSWYICIEVHPAAGTSDVPGTVKDYLHENVYQDLDSSLLKERILIGRITGVRADIVHNGKARVDASEDVAFAKYLDALERIARTCLRLLGGLHPGDALDDLVHRA